MAEVVPVRLSSRPARVAWPTVALAATLGFGALAAGAAHPPDGVLGGAGDLAVAVAFVGCGAALWARERTGGLSGPLMVATGVAWMLGDVADGLALLHRGPLMHLLAAAPDGRPRTWPQRLIVAAGYLDGLVADVGRDDSATAALAVALAAVAVGRWARAGGVQQRSLMVPAAAATVIALVLGAARTADAADGEAVLWSYQGVLVLTAAALFVDLRRGSTRASATRLVIDLGDAPGGRSLTAALARAAGDPSLTVGYPIGDGRLVDEQGGPVALPTADANRAVTKLGTGAVLVHDRTALRAPGLADSIAAAVRLALDNVRLQSEIRARLQDVQDSRARLVGARDSERRDLEARLRATVGPRLDAAARLLAGLEDDPEPLVSALPGDLDLARTELRRFAAGLHPRDLEEGGLPVALPALAAGAPLPVEVSVRCARLAPVVETAAWFVCSEALANVVKHAAATRATIHVERSRRWLVVTVDDDGRGGADAAAGRGLRGLAARVEAAGGRLELADGPAGGTTLRAWLPAQEQT